MPITNYKSFVEEYKLLEGLREMKFVLSGRLIEQLSKINHVISDELMKLHNDLNSSQKQTFVDITDKDDKLSFIQSNKASELLNIETEEKYDKIDKSLLNDIDISNPVYKQFRTEVAIGRFINSVFGVSRFPASSRSVTHGKPTDVESFVNMYKATFGQSEKFKLMEVVTGDKIAYFYNHTHYANEEEGTLGGSCMSDVSEDYFEIYTSNPNVGLLILYSSESKRKIKGRAIVWKNLIEPDGRTYMDRIYTNDSSDEELFKEYAKKQGWLHKSHQGYGAESNIVDTVTDSNRRITLIGQLKPNHCDYYPYLDTMCYYNPDDGRISNRETGMKYMLVDTGGDYDELDYNEDQEEVWSNYHDRSIYESDAKWCEFGQDWVEESEAIKVWNTGNKYAVPGNPDVVRSYIPNYCDKYFEKSRCTWSDYLNTWVFNGALINVWTDPERTNSVVEYKKRSGVTFAEVDGEFWKMDLLEKIGDGYQLKSETVESPKRPVTHRGGTRTA